MPGHACRSAGAATIVYSDAANDLALARCEPGDYAHWATEVLLADHSITVAVNPSWIWPPEFAGRP